MVSTPGPPRDELLPSLLATCRRPVFVYVMSLLHNASDAEEVLQETEIVLWQKFDQYQPGTDFIRWACAIARFEALKARARRSREAKLLSDTFVENLASEAERTIDLLEARREALQRCLGKLDDAARDLVLRRYADGGRTRTVAAVLGRSVQGTRKALHRIRNVLAECVRRSLAQEENP
jgi:RNA polymerase sigma-70 factor (ECF subfamily)